MSKITPNLWFDTEGEEAAEFYTSIFPNSRIVEVTRYGPAGPRPEGMVMTVAFELDGQRFVALNGGPDFKFTEAVSFEIRCEDQEEVDSYSSKLIEGGGEQGPCGWVKDRFGLSWQVIPKALIELLADADHEKAQRVMAAMLQMQRIDVAELERAAAGSESPTPA
jgi:predicted 3-demethylubiquinone-9 3-methyltransferase (glyoxalase superfamily)